MTLFIQRQQDNIFVNQLRIGTLSTKNSHTGMPRRPGAEWLEVHGRSNISLLEVSGHDEICAVFATICGEEAEVSSQNNYGLAPDLIADNVGPAEFYYWRNVLVGSKRDFGLFWDAGPIQLQWLAEDGYTNPTPPQEIIAAMVRRALACESDLALPDWPGWKLWPPVRDESIGPYVAKVRIVGEPEKPCTPSVHPIAYLQVIRRGDTNEIACAGWEQGEGVTLVPLTILDPQLDGSNLKGLFFQGDSLEDLTFEEWKSLFETFSAVICVGRSGRSWIETATLEEAQFTVTAQEVALLLP